MNSAELISAEYAFNRSSLGQSIFFQCNTRNFMAFSGAAHVRPTVLKKLLELRRFPSMPENFVEKLNISLFSPLQSIEKLCCWDTEGSCRDWQLRSKLPSLMQSTPPSCRLLVTYLHNALVCSILAHSI